MYATTPAAKKQRKGAGFKGGNFSIDGKFVLGRLFGKLSGCDDCDHDLAVPDFLDETYPVTTYVSEDTGKKTMGMRYVDGAPVEVEVAVMKRVTVIIQKPLTNNHPHYNRSQAKYIISLLAWSGDKGGVPAASAKVSL